MLFFTYSVINVIKDAADAFFSSKLQENRVPWIDNGEQDAIPLPNLCILRNVVIRGPASCYSMHNIRFTFFKLWSNKETLQRTGIFNRQLNPLA